MCKSVIFGHYACRNLTENPMVLSKQNKSALNLGYIECNKNSLYEEALGLYSAINNTMTQHRPILNENIFVKKGPSPVLWCFMKWFIPATMGTRLLPALVCVKPTFSLKKKVIFAMTDWIIKRCLENTPRSVENTCTNCAETKLVSLVSANQNSSILI